MRKIVITDNEEDDFCKIRCELCHQRNNNNSASSFNCKYCRGNGFVKMSWEKAFLEIYLQKIEEDKKERIKELRCKALGSLNGHNNIKNIHRPHSPSSWNVSRIGCDSQSIGHNSFQSNNSLLNHLVDPSRLEHIHDSKCLNCGQINFLETLKKTSQNKITKICEDCEKKNKIKNAAKYVVNPTNKKFNRKKSKSDINVLLNKDNLDNLNFKTKD